MGGLFGVISRQDCVYDLFYGTDYHSHLGTKRGGLAPSREYIDETNEAILETRAHPIAQTARRSSRDLKAKKASCKPDTKEGDRGSLRGSQRAEKTGAGPAIGGAGGIAVAWGIVQGGRPPMKYLSVSGKALSWSPPMDRAPCATWTRSPSRTISSTTTNMPGPMAPMNCG